MNSFAIAILVVGCCVSRMHHPQHCKSAFLNSHGGRFSTRIPVPIPTMRAGALRPLPGYIRRPSPTFCRFLFFLLHIKTSPPKHHFTTSPLRHNSSTSPPHLHWTSSSSSFAIDHAGHRLCLYNSFRHRHRSHQHKSCIRTRS